MHTVCRCQHDFHLFTSFAFWCWCYRCLMISSAVPLQTLLGWKIAPLFAKDIFSILSLLLSFVFLFWSKELFMISLFGCYGSVLVNVHDLPLTKLIRIRILDRQRFSYEYLNSSIAKKANYIYIFFILVLRGLIVSLCWQLLMFPCLPKCLIVLQNQVLTWWRQSQSTCKFLCLLACIKQRVPWLWHCPCQGFLHFTPTATRHPMMCWVWNKRTPPFLLENRAIFGQ